MLLRSLMFMMWRRDLGTLSTARSFAANAFLAYETTIAASMTKPTAWTQEFSEVWFWRRWARPRVLNCCLR